MNVLLFGRIVSSFYFLTNTDFSESVFLATKPPSQPSYFHVNVTHEPNPMSGGSYAPVAGNHFGNTGAVPVDESRNAGSTAQP